jgi:hypothetical protein
VSPIEALVEFSELLENGAVAWLHLGLPAPLSRGGHVVIDRKGRYLQLCLLPIRSSCVRVHEGEYRAKGAIRSIGISSMDAKASVRATHQDCSVLVYLDRHFDAKPHEAFDQQRFVR